MVVGVEKPFGQQVQELEQTLAPRGAESRRRDRGSAGRPGSRRGRSAARCRAAATSWPATTASARRRRGRRSSSCDDQPRGIRGRCWPSASTIRMNLPVAWRMPVLTAAPLPLLYGWRITRAPAAAARSAVVVGRSVVDDQNLVPARRGAEIGDERADGRSSLNAGMTIDVGAGHWMIGRVNVARSHVQPAHVAKRKLMMSPSCTTYSLPSSRTSPWSRHAAIDPRADERVVADDFRADESARDVAVDLAGRELRRTCRAESTRRGIRPRRP